MRTIRYHTDELKKQFLKQKILTLDQVKEVLGTTVTMTAIRKLKEITYRTSYSHAGKYYSLDEIADYDEYGLWSFNRIHFSEQGSLINTIHHLVDASETGFFASELKRILKVPVQDSLLNLYKSQKLRRRQIVSEYLYMSIGKWQIQLEHRRHLIEASGREKKLHLVPSYDSPEVRKSLQLFLSMLNEKQRRLFVGLESMKLGRGGDITMSKITGIDVKTIAKGRNELLSHEITPDKIRENGAGRPFIKKKKKY